MVQPLVRGIEISLIIQERGSVTVVEVASAFGVDKSTVSRPMAALMHYDMVSIDPVSKRYRLGFRDLHLSEGVKKNFNVAIVVRPYLYKTCNNTKEGVYLAATESRKMYIVDQVWSQREYNLSAQIGMTKAWHCPAVGKCALAYKSPSLIEDISRDYDFERYTSNTITTYQNLERELKKIREQGYTLDDEKRTLGVRCLVVPIFNYSDDINCCIGISAPKEQTTEAATKKYALCMRKHGSQISKELGYGSYRNQGMLQRQKQKRVLNMSNFIDKFSLTSKKAIVTDDAKGLCNGMVQALHDAGAEVALLDILDMVGDSVGETAEKGPVIHAVRGDPTRTEELGNIYNECLENLGGKVDILLGGTGIQFRAPAVNLLHDR